MGRKLESVAAAALISIGSSGCGTIIHGNDQRIQVLSRPSGAQVIYQGAVRGVTPTDVEVNRHLQDNVLVIQKEGFVERELVVKNGVSLWALLGNAVFLFIPGWIVDAATGSFGAAERDYYEVDLTAVDED